MAADVELAQYIAGDLFPLATFLAFFHPPVAAGIAHRPFQEIFAGEWSAPASKIFHLDPWSLIGVVTIGAAVFISIRIFRQTR